MVFVGRNWQATGSYGMGAVAADFDNDGWSDIYVACDSAPSLLYRNNHDGTFREVAVSAGCALDENGVALSGMGVAVADYDADGWLDIARTNFSEQLTTLYHNYGEAAFEDASVKAGFGGNRNNWIMFKCVGTRSNRSAIGARVKLTTGTHVQIDEVMSGSSYYSQSDFRLHFGLGRAATADRVEVAWPSGGTEIFENLAAN